LILFKCKMKSYLMPRSNQPYICHWCKVIMPTHSPYVKVRRYYTTLKMHVACTKQLVQREWISHLDLRHIGEVKDLDMNNADEDWQEYINGELSQNVTPTIR